MAHTHTHTWSSKMLGIYFCWWLSWLPNMYKCDCVYRCVRVRQTPKCRTIMPNSFAPSSSRSDLRIVPNLDFYFFFLSPSLEFPPTERMVSCWYRGAVAIATFGLFFLVCVLYSIVCTVSNYSPSISVCTDIFCVLDFFLCCLRAQSGKRERYVCSFVIRILLQNILPHTLRFYHILLVFFCCVLLCVGLPLLLLLRLPENFAGYFFQHHFFCLFNSWCVSVDVFFSYALLSTHNSHHMRSILMLDDIRRIFLNWALFIQCLTWIN